MNPWRGLVETPALDPAPYRRQAALERRWTDGS
jgi:hypothetical protein